MNLTIARRTLHEVLQTAGRAVSQHTSLPVLKNVALYAEGDTLRLSATDLELAITLEVAATVTAGGCLCVPAKTLAEIVAALPEGDVTLSAAEDLLTVKAGRSEYRVNGLSAEDFPALPEVGDAWAFSVPEGDLRTALKQTLYAASDDDTRPILTGVLVKVADGVLRLVATDTHRLACIPLVGAFPAAGSCIVPQRALGEVLRLLGDGEGVKVQADPNQIRFEVGRAALVSRLIEGQFPKFERVIPSSHTRLVTMDREDLLGALKRARIVAREAAAKDRVILTFDADSEGDCTLTISADGDGGRAEERLSCAWEGDPPTAPIAFNAGYLAEALGSLTEERVRLEMSEPLSPTILRGEGAVGLSVLMPMALQ